MPLSPQPLADELLRQWLVESSHPGDAFESGKTFGNVVATWFAEATASGFPCTTALAKAEPLAAQAAAAFQTQAAPAAGAALDAALSVYMMGQLFGTGASAPPVLTGSLGPSFGVVFADLESSRESRADTLSLLVYAMAVSTPVVFPPPLPPATVL